MDPYTTEKWYLERWQAVARGAEARSRLLRAEQRTGGLGEQLAAVLRRVADRLDGRPELELQRAQDGNIAG
jgi:hypothetical protein